MDAIHKILEQHAQTMVEQCAVAVADDIVDMLNNGLGFADTEPAVGAAVVPVEPLSGLRIRDYPRPKDAPRVLTGAMRDSIQVEPGALEADVDIGLIQQAEVQHGGTDGAPWTDDAGNQAPPVPARPFWGISKRAVEKSDRIVKDQGDRMVAAMQPIILPTLTVSV